MKKSSTNSAANFLKHIISLVTCIAKAKSMAIKGKADAVKTRLVVFSLLKNKKLSLGGISHKIHAILGQQDKNHNVTAAAAADNDDDSKAIVVYNAATDANDEAACSSSTSDSHYLQYMMMMHDDHDDDVDDKYPDLTHSLFDELDDDELGDPNASIIELVRNSKEEGQDFRLEDEIDQVADLFIKKFHKRMRMQKLESFKRYQEMLERST